MDKVIKIYSQAVDKREKVCYTKNRMKDFNILQEKYLKVITDEKRESYQIFREMLLKYNKMYNLTAITDEKEVIYKHFLDSLMGESYFLKGANVCEVGSGAGFPSIPLKIFRDDLSFTLIESTGKKCEFLKAVVDKLSLNGVQIKNIRAEDGARSELRESFDVCCARAVARLNTLAEYCMPYVKKGGVMIAYKGRADEEVLEGKKAISLLGGGKISTYSYEMQEQMGSRTIVVAEKVNATPQKYPRGNGKERSAPIV